MMCAQRAELDNAGSLPLLGSSPLKSQRGLALYLKSVILCS